MPSILDPKFQYVPAAATDIRKTFARVRRQQAAEKARAVAVADSSAKVKPLRKVGA